jgi:hypothetical protein
MNTLIEVIGEKVQMALNEKSRETAENIIQDCEEWYNDYVRNLFCPMDDNIFMAVYMCGYDNIYWDEIQSALEAEFGDRMEEDL